MTEAERQLAAKKYVRPREKGRHREFGRSRAFRRSKYFGRMRTKEGQKQKTSPRENEEYIDKIGGGNTIKGTDTW